MLFSTQALSFGFGDTTILNNINLTFEDKDRIGFIGLNGAGKTTFLRLISGELFPENGSISRRNNLSVGYLKQNAGLDGNKSVYEEMLDAFSDVFVAEKRMREIETLFEHVSYESKEFSALSDEHRKLENYHSARNGYEVEYRIKTTLTGMGFADAYDKPISVMSGGERTRLALSKLLLSDVDLLILDEPTNHLDVSTMLWLEKYLQEHFKGALLIVSHDRYFLDKTVNKIWELEFCKITEFRGNYSRYKLLKEEKIYSDVRLYEKQQEQVASMLEYAERNIARASTSKSAKSRLHRLDNMELIEKPIVYVKPPVFNFSIINECNKNVLWVDDLCLKVKELTLIPKLSFEVYNHDKLAVVGSNGVGKSTLIKTLLGLENNQTDHYNPVPDLQSSAKVNDIGLDRQCNGAIKYGKNLRISYYDQENINLSPNNSVLEELWFRFPLMTQTLARSILAKMLFSAEDMDKRVSELSGGERAKLAFAIVTAEKSNLLFFDEPTNHLDLASREALEKGLNAYEGTLIYVSHDRYFMNATATSVLELTKEGVTLYKGGYDTYLAAKAAEQQKEKEEKEKQEALRKAEEKPAPAVKENKSFRTKEDRRKEALRQERVRELEKLITALEADIAILNDSICNGKDYSKMKDFYAELTQKQGELDALYEELDTLL